MQFVSVGERKAYTYWAVLYDEKWDLGSREKTEGILKTAGESFTHMYALPDFRVELGGRGEMLFILL